MKEKEGLEIGRKVVREVAYSIDLRHDDYCGFGHSMNHVEQVEQIRRLVAYGKKFSASSFFGMDEANEFAGESLMAVKDDIAEWLVRDSSLRFSIHVTFDVAEYGATGFGFTKKRSGLILCDSVVAILDRMRGRRGYDSFRFRTVYPTCTELANKKWRFDAIAAA